MISLINLSRAHLVVGAALIGLLLGVARASGDSLALCLGTAALETVLPWDQAYDPLRRVSSQMWSTYPRAIVLPSSEDDIVAALACARQSGVRVTARGGGHGNAGQSVINGALSVNLSKLKRVTVSEDLDTVVVQTGATAGEVVHDIVLASNGTRNIPVGQKPTVGMAGLTLGGGWGFFSRQYGLLCDQLISVRMVLPSGEIVVATAENEHSEMFWASCGGGGGHIGIATEFRMRTVPTPQRIQRIHVIADQTVENVAFYQKLSPRLSDKVTLNLEVTNGLTFTSGTSSDIALPPGAITNNTIKALGEFFIELVGIYLGEADDFFDELERLGVNDTSPIPISTFRDGVKESTAADAQLYLMGWANKGKLDDLLAPYADQNTYYNYVSLFLYEPLDEEAIQILLDAATWNTDGSSLSYEFQSLGGGPSMSAVARVGVTDTAFSHRQAQFGLLMKSNSREPNSGNSLYGRMREAYSLLLATSAPSPPPVYVNMVDNMLDSPLESYYGIYGAGVNGDETVQRLRSLADVTNPGGNLTTIQPF